MWTVVGFVHRLLCRLAWTTCVAGRRPTDGKRGEWVCTAAGVVSHGIFTVVCVVAFYLPSLSTPAAQRARRLCWPEGCGVVRRFWLYRTKNISYYEYTSKVFITVLNRQELGMTLPLKRQVFWQESECTISHILEIRSNCVRTYRAPLAGKFLLVHLKLLPTNFRFIEKCHTSQSCVGGPLCYYESGESSPLVAS